MSAHSSAVVLDDRQRGVEVLAKATRRRFTAEYKLRVLREADACREPGAIGAVLRREGLYTSHLCLWRKQRRARELMGLTPARRGPVPEATNPVAATVAALEKTMRWLTARAERAEALVELQKKSLRDPRDRTQTERRDALMAVVAQQRTGGGIAPACAALSVARASFYQRPHPKGTGPRRPRFVPRALPPEERTRVLAVLNDDRFADRAPAQVYATLLDEGRFLCSIPPPCTGSFGRAGWFGTGATSGVTRATTSRNCWPRGRMRCGPGIARNSWVR